MKTILACTIFLLCTFICKAERFLNLGFELMAYGSTTPLSWDIGGNGYTLLMDSVVKYNGKYSLRIEGAGKTGNDYAHCSGILVPGRVNGKKLRITGFVRTTGLSDGNATLYGIVYGKTGMLKYQDNKDGPKGTTEWKELTIEIAVSKEATLVSFGCAMTGKGKAWFDNLKVYLNDTLLDDNANMPVEPTEQELNWLRTRLIPVRSLEINSDYKDLETIDAMASSATVIGLGEVTHGSDEIYRIKNRLVKNLVEKEGYSVFALEANMPEAYRLNDYIVNGKGNPKKLLYGMRFWIWDTREMVDLVKWMKEYNSGHSKKVIFTGIDMQLYSGPFEEVCNICKSHHNSAVLSTLGSLEDTLTEFGKRMKKRQALSVKAEEFLKSEWELLRKFAKSEVTDTQQREWLLQNIRLLEQCTEDFNQSRRNEFMAENLLWIKTHNPDSKIIVWAHNAHIQKTGTDMGELLNGQLNKNYAAVGFTFHEGSFTGNGNKGVATYLSQPSRPGSYEYYFHKSGTPMSLMDLRNVSKTDSGGKWLYHNLDFRRTGASPMFDEFEPMDIVGNFDILVFSDKSAHSISLHKHRNFERHLAHIFKRQ